MIKFKRILTVTLMLLITLTFVSPSETYAYFDESIPEGINYLDPRNTDVNIEGISSNIKVTPNTTYSVWVDHDMYNPNYFEVTLYGYKTLGEESVQEIADGDFMTYSELYEKWIYTFTTGSNTDYVIMVLNHYDDTIQIPADLNGFTFQVGDDFTGVWEAYNPGYQVTSSTWQLGTYINYGYDSGSATFNVIVPEAMDGHNTSIPVRIEGTHETNTCVSFQSVKISDHNYSLGGIIDKDDYIELNIPITQVTYDEANSRYVLDLQDLSWNGCASGSTAQAPTTNLYVSVTGDMITPVIDGYNGVYITNMDNPVTAEEIKALLTATDDLDGDITGSIMITSDEYTDSFSTIEETITDTTVWLDRINEISVYNTVQDTFKFDYASLYPDLLEDFDDVRPFVNAKQSLTIDGTLFAYSNSIYSDDYSFYFKNGDLILNSNNSFGDSMEELQAHLEKGYEFTYTTETTKVTPGDYDIDYSVTDAGGNTTTLTITVRVVDVGIPVITLDGPSEYTLAYSDDTTCDWDRILPSVTITDNLDTNLTATTTNNFDCQSLGTYTITYDVTDSNGNQAEQVIVTVHVVDATSPIVTLNGLETIDIEFGDNYSEQDATCSDNYDSSCTVTHSGTVNVGVLGTYSITYSATDSHGNTGTKIRTVNVVDSTKPIITIEEQNTFVAGEAPSYAIFISALSIMDNHDGDITDNVVVTLNEYEGNENTPGTYRVNLQVTDSSGNVQVAFLEFAIIDNEAPQFYVPSDTFLTREEVNSMTLQDYYDYFNVNN